MMNYVDTVTDLNGDFIVSYQYYYVQSQFATTFGGAVQNTQNFEYRDYTASFVKINGSTGQIQWTVSMAGPQSAYVYKLITDQAGNLIATGQLFSAVAALNFYFNGVLVYTLPQGTTSSWQTQWSSAGQFQWASFLPNEFIDIKGLAVDSGNNIFQMSQANQALSYLYGGFSFTPVTSVCNVRKVNPSGVELWRVNIGYAAVVTCNSAIAVSQSTGDVYVAGSFTFGDTMQNGYNTSIGQIGVRDSANQLYIPQQSNMILKSALFLAKFSSSGGFQWMVRIDDSQPVPSALSVSPNGYVSLVGSYQNTAYPLGFYNVSGQLGRSVNSSRVLLSGFVATYSPAGALRYVATMDGASNDKAVSSAVDAGSNVFVATQCLSSSVIVVDGLGNSQSIQSSSSTVLKFGPSGEFLYSFRSTYGLQPYAILKGYDQVKRRNLL
ncbi:hypothetical protein MP228_009472 [Amoeboaphelidium protococcarum]|nr:hypothetical protein MP228_009472 [Amoeboaphelidium protococcarum]